LIRRITREFANLTVTELAATLCELLEWRRPNGGLKSRECYLFLLELQRRGWLPWLPAVQPRRQREPRVKPETSAPRPAVIARPLPKDWQARYGLEPVLMETLVDPARYRGTCYRAANWMETGMTQGRGRMDRSHRSAGVPKQIFLFPLHRHWRQRLCAAELTS